MFSCQLQAINLVEKCVLCAKPHGINDCYYNFDFKLT